MTIKIIDLPDRGIERTVYGLLVDMVEIDCTLSLEELKCQLDYALREWYWNPSNRAIVAKFTSDFFHSRSALLLPHRLLDFEMKPFKVWVKNDMLQVRHKMFCRSKVPLFNVIDAPVKAR